MGQEILLLDHAQKAAGRAEGGEAFGHSVHQKVGHHAAVGMTHGVDPFGVDMIIGDRVVQQRVEIRDVVNAAVAARVPGRQGKRAQTAALRIG